MKWPDLGPGEWGRSGRLSYLRPIGWTLHGVLAERSGTPDSVYLWELRMPLTVPTDVLDLSWSERVGGGAATFAIDSAEANAACVAAAAGAREIHQQSPAVLDPPGGADNVRMQEARAYGLVVSGEVDSAREVVARVLRHRPRYGWEREIIDRAQAIQRLLNGPDPASALGQIMAWRATTMTALGVVD